jgi:hypothetical protein
MFVTCSVRIRNSIPIAILGQPINDERAVGRMPLMKLPDTTWGVF